MKELNRDGGTAQDSIEKIAECGAQWDAELCVEPEVDKKTLKRDVRKAGWGLILYTAVLYGVVIVDMIWQVIVETMMSPGYELSDEQVNALVTSLSESAVSMIAGVTIGAVVLWLFMSNRVSLKSMFETKRPMTGKLFFECLCVFMAVQLVFSLFAEGLELVLNLFGYSAMESIEAASGSSNTISMFVYASFVAPVIEEVVYRGFILGALRKYGKMFAIVISAVLFGIMHGNIPQAVFAFFVGLVLGIVAEEYSLKWAILIHMCNNFVFAELIGLLGKVFGEGVETALNVIVIYGFFFVGAGILWKQRSELKKYVRENAAEGKLYRWALTTVPIMIFLIVNFLIGLLGIQPL